MNQTFCGFKDLGECPVSNEIPCARRGKPLFSYDHMRYSYEKKFPECYFWHLYLCKKCLDKLKGRFIKSLRRLLERYYGYSSNIMESTLEEIIDILVVEHDVGKLMQTYQNACQNHKPPGFRHEIVSAYIVYISCKEALKEKKLPDTFLISLSRIVGAAVYIHHEGIHLKYGLKHVRSPYSSFLLHYLLRKAKNGKFEMFRQDALGNWYNIQFAIEKALCQKSFLSFNFKERNSLDAESVFKTVSDIVIGCDGGGPPLRLIVSNFALLLRLADNWSASMWRSSGKYDLSYAEFVEEFVRGVINE